mgnify:CR=1 FL=1
MGSGDAPVVISGPAVGSIYRSTRNKVRLQFVTSEETELEGWKINWREVRMTTTAPETTPARKH